MVSYCHTIYENNYHTNGHQCQRTMQTLYKTMHRFYTMQYFATKYPVTCSLVHRNYPIAYTGPKKIILTILQLCRWGLPMSICLSVCLSLCLSNAWIVTKRKHLAPSSIMTNRKLTTSFPMSLRWTAYVPLSPQRGLKNANWPFFL